MALKTTGNFINSSSAEFFGGATNNVSLSFVLAIYFGGQSPPIVGEKLKVKS